MRWNYLLFWMTHSRDGAWGGFVDAVQSMLPEGEDRGIVSRNLRLHFSEFGDTDFFVDGTRRWRMRPSALALLAGREGEAVLVGNRTRSLVERLAAEAAVAGCSLTVEGHQEGPSVYRLNGQRDALAAAAAGAGIHFAAGMAEEACAQGTPVTDYFRQPKVERTPPNWVVKSFDFATMSMCDGARVNSACECTPRHGLPLWYLQLRHGLIPMPKREAIYAAAMLQRVTLLEYFPAQRVLSVRPKTPMPEQYMRAACLCSGKRAELDGGWSIFCDVPPRLATMLCAATGQPFPQS